MWLTDEQQQIWRGYLTMVSQVQTAMHRQLQRDCELSLTDYDVLVALSETGPQRMNELGEVSDGNRAGCHTSCVGCAAAAWWHATGVTTTAGARPSS